jgi:hypothetical protein
MKYDIKQPTSLRDAIRELGPYIRDDELGYRFSEKSYDGLLVREALGNWLLCAVLNHREGNQDRWTFTTEPRSGPGADGAILDKTTGEALSTEHVMATRRRNGKRVEKVEESAEQLLIETVQNKVAKGGAAYASNTVLVVYLDANVAGYSPRALREQLPADLPFADVWLVVPQAGYWDYDVVYLGGPALDPPLYRVSITEAFDDWTVTPLPWPPVTGG